LLLEKPVATDGFSSLFATLDSLAGAQAHSGFRGMMRQVGLQEVIQMECLGRKSSLLEVFASNMRGRIYICDGSIIHAESGPVRGEAALYGLLALQDGEFNLSQFSEPPQRTIEGPWEFLLMEAARLTDEASQNLPLEAAQSEAESASMDTQHFMEGSLPTQVEKEIGSAWNVPSFSQANPASPSLPEPKARSLESTLSAAPTQVKIEEVALCSGSGELLYEWQCQPLEGRLRLLQQVEQQAAQVTNLITVGRFDRLEIITPEGRIVCHLQQDRRLFVRSSTLTQPAP